VPGVMRPVLPDMPWLLTPEYDAIAVAESRSPTSINWGNLCSVDLVAGLPA